MMVTQLPAYQTPISSDDKDASTVIPLHMLAYFRGRFSNKIHELVLTEFAAHEREGKTSRAEIARKIRRKPEQITRWLGSPGNWTLDTVSDLLLALGAEPVVTVRNIEDERTRQIKSTEHTTLPITGLQTLVAPIEIQTAEQVATDLRSGNGKEYYMSFSTLAYQTLTTNVPELSSRYVVGTPTTSFDYLVTQEQKE